MDFDFNYSIGKMDPALYNAAVEGNTECKVVEENEEFSRQVTPNGNTILHVAALHGHTVFVQKILNLGHASSLLCAQNMNKETALHIATKQGHAEVVSALISCAKECKDPESTAAVVEMLRITDNDKDTALHVAVREGHLRVVKLLLDEELGKDDDFEFQPNEAGETPLYLAAESEFYECLSEILKSRKNPVFGGPFGRTALHAAIISATTKESDCIESLLIWERNHCRQREKSMLKVADDWGWTPLHYAAALEDVERVGDILQIDSSAAYVRAGKDGDWTTVFHIAASHDSVHVMKVILKHCPDCWDMFDSNRQNVLHEAARSRSMKVIEFILSSPNAQHLIKDRDEDGNTPLHLFVELADCFLKPEWDDRPRRNHNIFNKQHLTPHDIKRLDADEYGPPELGAKLFGLRGYHVDSKVKEEKNAEKTNDDTKQRTSGAILTSLETQLVVATLIATIAFTAGFTVPGGYDSNAGPTQGMPVLIRKTAFRAFIVTDILAFNLSLVAIFAYMTLITGAALPLGISSLLYVFASYALWFGFVAVGLAFTTGVYAILTHSMGYAINALILGSLALLPCYFLRKQAVRNIIAAVRRVRIRHIGEIRKRARSRSV